ncbi:hypothetical protein QUB68_28810 [Microcoleus sp. A006_D1]
MAQPELNLPIGRSGLFPGDADIYNSNENFWSIDPALSVECRNATRE